LPRDPSRDFIERESKNFALKQQALKQNSVLKKNERLSTSFRFRRTSVFGNFGSQEEAFSKERWPKDPS